MPVFNLATGTVIIKFDEPNGAELNEYEASGAEAQRRRGAVKPEAIQGQTGHTDCGKGPLGGPWFRIRKTKSFKRH